MRLLNIKRPRMLLTLCLLTMLVSACNHGPATDTFCVINEPIRPTSAQIAKMTDSEVRRTLTHNEYGAKRCGWKA